MHIKLTPPTGHILYLKDLIHNNHEILFKGYWLNSGTAALYFLVKNLNIPVQSKILIPAYSCPTVAAAVLRAGHFPVLADINLENLGYDLNKLKRIIKQQDIKAIIKVNLFGLSSPPIETNLPVIEDNAQSNPLTQQLNNSSAGIYSFGRGKPINALGGGMAVVHNEKSFNNLSEYYSALSDTHLEDNIKYLIKFFGYKVFYHPFLYKILFSIPSLKLGETVFDPDFIISKIGWVNINVIKNIFVRFNAIQQMRKKICQRYDQILNKLQSKFLYFPDRMFYRYPLILKEDGLRNHLVTLLQMNGIGAFPLYPFPLSEQSGLKEILNDRNEYPHAKYISKKLFTLPVNEFITDGKLEIISSILKENL